MCIGGVWRVVVPISHQPSAFRLPLSEYHKLTKHFEQIIDQNRIDTAKQADRDGHTRVWHTNSKKTKQKKNRI